MSVTKTFKVTVTASSDAEADGRAAEVLERYLNSPETMAAIQAEIDAAHERLRQWAFDLLWGKR